MLTNWVNYAGFNRPVLEIEAAISRFNWIDLLMTDFEKVVQAIAPVITGYVTSDKGWPLNGIYRARKNEDGKSFDNISQLWARPAKDVKKYGRLNQPGESIFYAAEVSQVSLAEIKVKVGDVVTIMELQPFQRGKQLSVIDLGVYHTDCGLKSGYKNTLQVRKGIESKIGFKNIEAQNLILDFMVQEMTKKVSEGAEWEYKPTAAIAELLWRRSKYFRCAIYPSVAKNLHGINIALYPDYVAENYYIPRLNEIEIIEVSEKDIKFNRKKHIKEPIGSKGEIPFIRG
jgi:hypothetical protein